MAPIIWFGFLFISQQLRSRQKNNNILQVSYSSGNFPDEIGSGHKQILQQFSHYLFGVKPVYSWNKEDNGLTITLPDGSKYERIVYLLQNVTMTAAERKQQEQNAAANVFYQLECNSTYSSQLQAWLTNKLNKDNTPRILKLSDAILKASNKTTIVLVDVENVPDFRKAHFININGDIHFSSPCIPQLYKAPTSITDSNQKEFINISTSKQINCISDDDILILGYAHNRSNQSIRANRITTSTSRDAADALMLLDFGAIQLLPQLQRVILVTDDHIGKVAVDCAKSELKNDTNLKQFISVSTCSEAARLIGRL
eukprot:gene7756-15872_t